MRGLNPLAKEALAVAGISQAEWGRHFFQDAELWHGDECGCSDDRCIGFHHEPNEPCGCLPALIQNREQDTITDRLARLTGIPRAEADALVWQAVRAGNALEREAWARQNAARQAAAAEYVRARDAGK